MAGIDLSQLIDAIGSNNQSLDTASNQIITAYSQLNNLTAQNAADLKTIGDTAKVQVLQAETAQLESQNNARKVAADLGNTPNVAGSLVNDLSAEIVESYRKAQAQLEQIEQKESVGFFDNPLEFIVNQLTIDENYDNYENNIAQLNLASSTFDKINSLTSTTAAAQNAIAETRTTATIEAKLKESDAITRSKIREVEANGILRNVQGVEAVARLDAQKLDNLFKIKSAINAEEQLALSRANAENARANAALALQERQDKVKAKQDTLEAEALFVETINKGRDSQGLAPLPATNIKQFMQLGGNMKQQLENWYATGSNLTATGQVNYGTSPVGAISSLLQAKAPAIKTYEPVTKVLSGVLGEVSSGRGEFAAINTKDRAQVETVANKTILTVMGNYAKRIKTEDDSNPYQAPDLKSLGETTAVANTTLYKSIIGPAIEAGNLPVKTNPDLILSTAIRAVTNGQLNFNTAANDIAIIFKQAVSLNNEYKGFDRFLLPEQKTYNAQLSAGDYTIRDTVDLTDPKQVSLFMAKSLATPKGISTNLTSVFDALRIQTQEVSQGK